MFPLPIGNFSNVTLQLPSNIDAINLSPIQMCSSLLKQCGQPNVAMTRLKKSVGSKSRDNPNVMSAFKPIYIVLTMFGLLPYSLRFPQGEEGAITIRNSIYFNSLCSVSIILILYSFFVLHTQQVFAAAESNTMTEVLATKFNYIVEMFTLIMFATISYYCAYKNRLTYVKILNTIVSSSNKYRKAASLRRIQVQVRVITACLGVLLVLQCAVNFTRFDAVGKMMLVTASFILPQMIQFAVLSFYHVLMLMVVGMLKNVNDQVNGIVKARKFNAAEFVKVEMRTVGLRHVEVVYINMLEAKREINKAFEASMLATAIQCFHSIVSEAHILYHGLVVGNALTSHDVCNCSIWIGYQMLKIYIMSCSGNMLKEQVAKIGRSLHNIPTGKQDIRLYLEIQHFSSLMLYQNAEMTVYNYFPLDATLTFNVMSAAVMYLVMLVQFDRNP